MSVVKRLLLFALFTSIQLFAQIPAHKNFRVAVYIPESTVERMTDSKWLQTTWTQISSQVKVDKVYIETYRNRRMPDAALIERLKEFFRGQGVQVAGGVAYSVGGSSQFISFSYSDPADRAYVKQVAEFTARHFDEIMLDDFFFNNTKTDADIAAKGTRSWTQFRLDLMDQASRELVLDAARAVNPRVKVIIKFPNWYEHFQANGYDLDRQPKMFDGIYTGTETRDPVMTDQHLQQYESYEVYRYFENIKPGGNGGAWVDTFDVRYVDRYAEQLWDSMFAKAPEMMLFCWDLLLQEAKPGDRPWKSTKTTFDYAEMAARKRPPELTAANMATVAGYALEKADAVTGSLGKPIGLASYKPYQSTGEDFLHNYLGMAGIPIEMYPTFPTDASTVLLTASARFDPDIVGKVKSQLKAGKKVVITSGLLCALQGKGIADIVELDCTGNKLMVDEFWASFGPGAGTPLGKNSGVKVLVPEISFMTNDAWPVVRGTANGHGAPIVIMERYSRGVLYILTIPDNFNDVYTLPPDVLHAIRAYLLTDFPVQLDAPAKVALFAYDNDTFIVESYLDEPVTISVATKEQTRQLRNLASNDLLQRQPTPPKSRQRNSQVEGALPRSQFQVTIAPHSFVAFREEK